jgi:serine protease
MGLGRFQEIRVDIKEDIVRIFVAILMLIELSVSANFIIKLKNGTVIKSKIDPRKSLAIMSDNGEVDYIEEDRVMMAHYVQNDPFFNNQWALSNYLNSSFIQMKDVIASKRSITVAVVDTGIRPHSELNNRILPGQDFISDAVAARDGNGRDTDASDPGDYGDASVSCSVTSFGQSSWHGTHIAGIIAATSNNSYGVAGANDKVKILPLRVLGPCGGQTSDIADAIRWAVGGSVSGTTRNDNPAKVINLSLGGIGECSRYMQEAIDFANTRGAVVVVSAGNNGANADSMAYTPANCRGVFRVGAIDSSLRESNFSNYGSIIDVSAPGDLIYSTFNNGNTNPSADSFSALTGTSMAAGFVSALAAAVFSVNSGLFPDQVKGIIRDNLNSMTCYHSSCSGGAIDPYQAVIDAQYVSSDSSYRYDDRVISGGYSSLSSTVETTQTKGGLCGTIVDVRKHSRKTYQYSYIFLGILFVFVNGYFFLTGLLVYRRTKVIKMPAGH